MSLRGAMQLLMFACLLMLGSLFALTGLRQFFIEPLGSGLSNSIWFGIQVLPLLAVTPGMLRFKARSYLIATLVGSLYLVHGVLLVSTPDLRTLGVWETAFALLLILAATYMVRLLRAISEPGDR